MQLAMKNEEHFETSKMKNLKRGTKLLSKKQRGGVGTYCFFQETKEETENEKRNATKQKKTITNIFCFNKIS